MPFQNHIGDEIARALQHAAADNLQYVELMHTVGGMQSGAFKQGLAQIAASEAQHLSYMWTENGLKAFNAAFPAALTIDQASAAMDAFTS